MCVSDVWSKCPYVYVCLLSQRNKNPSGLDLHGDQRANFRARPQSLVSTCVLWTQQTTQNMSWWWEDDEMKRKRMERERKAHREAWATASITLIFRCLVVGSLKKQYHTTWAQHTLNDFNSSFIHARGKRCISSRLPITSAPNSVIKTSQSNKWAVKREAWWQHDIVNESLTHLPLIIFLTNQSMINQTC